MTLSALRAVRWARVLLLLAAFAATAGAFGLHPEPGSGAPAPARDKDAACWTATPADAGNADACTACLAHRTVSLTGLAVFSPAGAPVLEARLTTTARRLRLFPPRLDDGRAPPALL